MAAHSIACRVLDLSRGIGVLFRVTRAGPACHPGAQQLCLDGVAKHSVLSLDYANIGVEKDDSVNVPPLAGGRTHTLAPSTSKRLDRLPTCACRGRKVGEPGHPNHCRVRACAVGVLRQQLVTGIAAISP